ncbi:four-carbon acid sugar kinase family protein [Thiobacter aerophilum]|uniref:Four-carbon acid sugar kinase family protein n=1 Tax=Thiobacter aerophilum TaxID=3121275 RepID=A0ABV0EDX9_9BURK
MQPKIIVLDDDPTGSQTVHSCLMLTRWDVDTLRVGLADASPLFFVLTNTRAMDAEQAAAVTWEVCHNLKEALQGFDRLVLYVSRSDSTLRGHYPVETDVMARVLGPFDAHFLIPAFFEGGRFTVRGIHYVRVGDKAVPAHETEFAKDSVFGYQHSYLPAYVEEKTHGRIRADEVVHFPLEEIRAGATYDKLMALNDNACCVVDAERQEDLNMFADEVLSAVEHGKRFLFRSAASWLTALTRLPPQPVPAERMGQYVKPGRAGIVVVGSHVKKTTEQLKRLLREPGIVPVEVDVELLPERSESLLAQVVEKVRQIHAAGDTPVVYTSRTERQFPDTATRLRFGEQVSAFLMSVVHALPPTIGYIVSKGGITSNDMLSKGLQLAAARIVGQILPGCSVVLTPPDHPHLPDMPVVIFPGNVGDEDALATVYNRLRTST